MTQFLSNIDLNDEAKIVNSQDPSNPQDVATKAYVDGAVEPTAWKDNARVASTTNITLTGPGASIDGITLANNDRVLVKDQSDASENGIYVFNGSATPMTRASDSNTFDYLEQAVISIDEGTSASTTFRQTAVNGTIDVSDVTWTTFGTAAPSASESTAGIAELATQGETDTGTDDTRIVTPLKLTNWSGRKLKATQTIGDASATAFNIDHNFGTRDVAVEVYRNSGNYDKVIVDVTRPTTNRVTVTFASAPGSNAFNVVVLG